MTGQHGQFGQFGGGAAGPRGPGWKRTGQRDWEHPGPLKIGKETFPYGGIWIGRRRGPQPPVWTPKPAGPRQIEIGRRAAEARAAQTAQRLAEQARAKRAADRAARERQRAAERARKQAESLRRQVERAREQREQRTTATRRRQEQRDRMRRRREDEGRRLRQRREAERRQAEQARKTKFTGPGDYLASLVPPLHRYPSMKRPILGAPFAKSGLEALANLKMREAFAGNFAMENVAFWSTQVAMVVGSIISGAGEFAAVARVASLSRTIKIPFKAPGVSVAEIGPGDLRASIQFQKMGARTIAVEPDPDMIPADALRRFQAGGGEWLGAGKTASHLGTNSVDHVVQYFPWEIGGAGMQRRFAGSGTWNAAEEGIRAARKTVTFVSDDPDTAKYLVRQARQSPSVSKVAWIKSTAREAAPGATGAGLRGVPPGQRVPGNRPVDLVVIYLAD